MIKNVVLFIFFLFLTGCVANDRPEQSEVNEPVDLVELNEKSAPIELELWSHYGDWEASIEQFEQDHPGVTIKVKQFSYEEYSQEFLKALAEKEVPDMMVFDSAHFGQFTALDGLENLAEEPYRLENYRDHFSPSLWNLGGSFDGERMIGVPLNSSPIVTYYRADIFENFGFPSDPEELGAYMEDPENWLDMAMKLKKEDKWMIQGDFDPIQIVESTKGIFNQELEFLRSDEEFKQAIDLAKAIRSNGLVSPINVWSESGIQAVKDDQLVMFYFGNWGSDQIKLWASEQSGKWRATRLPFNQFGWSNSPIMSIPTDSKQKEMAWEFIEFYAFGGNQGKDNPADLQKRNDFLGGQQDQLLFKTIMDKVEEPKLTPLDEEADAIWNATIVEGLHKNLSTEVILDSVTKKIDEQLGKDIEILLK